MKAADRIAARRAKEAKEKAPKPKTISKKAGRAASVVEYLAKLTPEKRAQISGVLSLVRNSIPAGYEEAINWGVISWHIPLSRFPDTYNGFPLTYVGLAAQKNYNSLYLMSVNGNKAQEARLQQGFEREGKKLDMGKACIHFQTEHDLALGVIRDLIARTSVDDYIALYRSVPRK
jgi:hypothetical protein